MPPNIDEVSAWVEDNWDEALTLREWWRRLADAGYSQPTWPVGLGGLGADDRTARTINDALAEHAVIAAPTGIGPSMGGPTVLQHGDGRHRRDPAQRDRRARPRSPPRTELTPERDVGPVTQVHFGDGSSTRINDDPQAADRGVA